MFETSGTCWTNYAYTFKLGTEKYAHNFSLDAFTEKILKFSHSSTVKYSNMCLGKYICVNYLQLRLCTSIPLTRTSKVNTFAGRGITLAFFVVWNVSSCLFTAEVVSFFAAETTQMGWWKSIMWSGLKIVQYLSG